MHLLSVYRGILTPSSAPSLPCRTDLTSDAVQQFLLPLSCFPSGFPGTGVWEEPEQGHHHLHVKKPFVSQLCAGVWRFMGYF